MVRFNLRNMATYLDSQLGSTGHFESKFGTEYLVPNVDEDTLIAAGFEFIGYDFQENHPMYRYENLEAFFDQTILHIYETP